MNTFKKRWRFVVRTTGFLLVVAAIIGAYFWFYKIAPMRHLASLKWLETHSEKARWIEEQKDYKRMGSSPDLEFRGDRIGYYGDKNWFLWLEEKATTDKNFRVCGCTETALALMTNQHTNSWEEWLKANRNKTQEEWIRDGFPQYGVIVHQPPDERDVEPLLKLIGHKRWNFLMGGPQGTNAPDAIPDYVQYNAFRWLRDSGFNPSRFAFSNATEVATQNLTLALVKYSQMEGSFPAHDNLGVLAFGKKSDGEFTFGVPWIATNRVVVIAFSAMILLLLFGLSIMFLPRKSKI
jgi:hypothetical protein